LSIRSTIASLFEQVAREQQTTLARWSDELKLLQSGLDYLSFALIITRLEEVLGFDAFDSAKSFPVTFGDFVRPYEKHSAESVQRR
jgi:hypothetical protein